MIVLHHVPLARSLRVLWLLEELDVPFETVVHPFGKNLRAPDYLAQGGRFGIDAQYGSATYQPMGDRFEYVVNISQDALIARPSEATKTLIQKQRFRLSSGCVLGG